MNEVKITLRTLTATYTAEARIEDGRTLSVARLTYLVIKATAASEVYAVAIINRKGHAYRFAGIVGDRAFFNR